MEVTALMVKTLREKTGAGMMDCKKALVETDGDMDKAIDLLREKGLSKAAKKADRIAAEGLVGVESSADGKSVAVLEINSETDFVAKNEEFKQLVKDVTNIVLTKAPATVEDLLKEQLNGTSVEEELNSKIAKIGEKMSIRRFERLTVDNGILVPYVHGAGKIVSVVKLETSSNDEKVQELGKDLAMQVAAMNPKYVSEKDIDQSYVEHEREILKHQAINENNELPEGKRKPEEIILKMLEGRLKKELKEVCLLEQAFVKEAKKSVNEVVAETAKAVGTSIEVAQIVRYEVGEGIEKKQEDFADEVAKQLGN